ncbi:ubiquitin family protein, partial [Klebsiella pneumoniae]
TAQHNVTMWRWLIAATFISEMKRENGTTTVTEADGTTSKVAIYSNGTAGIVVYPFAERLAMANNIEGAMIERYGIEQGTANAIVFYQAMIDTERGELTPFGRQTLAELHDGFIADLHENGLPEMPAAH